MDVSKILSELKAERAQIEEAILSLERLARGRGNRRGRPPAWMTEIAVPKKRGRPPGSKNKKTAPTAATGTASGSGGSAPSGASPTVRASAVA
jgi:hypothetical protein